MKIILADSLTQGGVNRSVRTNNSYDRLGRVEFINVDYGYSAPSQPLARYEYYPTGAVKRVILGNDAIAIDYTYHISGAVKTAVATNLADNSTLFSEALYYEDCGSSSCMPRYDNVSFLSQIPLRLFFPRNLTTLSRFRRFCSRRRYILMYATP